MNSSLYDVGKMKDLFTQYLNERGLRKTEERYMILKHICQAQGHFDVETLQKRLDDDHFHVSRASIYNTIETLMEAQLVVRHQFSSQLVQYELRNVAATHHHVICSYCGAVREVKNERLVKEMAHYRIPKFTQEYHSLYIYGMCSKCKFKLMHQKKKALNGAKKTEVKKQNKD